MSIDACVSSRAVRAVIRLCSAAALLIFCGLPAVAAPAPAASAAAVQPEDKPAAKPVRTPGGDAVVRVSNRAVTVLRAPFLGSPPNERAQRTERRISDLLDAGGAGKLSVQRMQEGNVVLIDGTLALMLTPGDIDAEGGQTLDAATESALHALSLVIAETREGRDRNRLLGAAGRSAVATLLFALVAWLTWRVRHALFARTAHMLEAATAGARVGGTPLLQSSRLRTLARWLVGVVSSLVLAVVTYEWLTFVLTEFPQTRPWGEQIGAFLVGIVRDLGGGILRSVPDLIVAAIIFLLASRLIKAFNPFFTSIERGRTWQGWLDRDMVRPTRRIVTIAVWLFAIVMAYPYLPGADSEAFKGMSVLVGLMITLGGSNIIGQAFAGLVLMYSRTVRVGEYVRINDHEGTVTELNTFMTRIRTGLGEEVSLPNVLVMGTVTKNYSRAVQGRGYIVDTVLTIGYDTPWRQVEAMMVEAATRTSGILDTPRPRVFQTALSDFYIEYRLVCQAAPEQPRPRAEVLHALHTHLLDVFNEHGVQIMSPHYLGDPAASKVVRAGDRYAAPEQKPTGR